ncbi:acyl-CoA dehydrogenase family protein [Natronomonas salina]|uniref:acyl-CoA dehydrogenase family protein n=1 Tax=Natronomonas salina TaxID=1710540 RepID=UPI0015B3C52A|nr:acyl-CoA dehydrogenase family protein [Natronomonas salina]QLD90379.1 acyl-CoA dehydrogenase family protein [Natronomonas salina]
MADPLDYSALERGRDCNYWEYDRALQRTVERRCDADGLEDLLSSFGELIGTTVTNNADVVEENPPELRTYDRNGERINEVDYHPAHLENERLVYEHGVIANRFSAPPGMDEPLSQVAHLAQFYLMDCSSSVGLSCPAAMTGGAAIVLEKFDDGTLDEYYDALTTREYDDLETGAMFLTEKQGGSDVGANEVRAEPTDDERIYELYGEKWFCSNIDSSAALVLARRPDAPAGTEGLSLFLFDRETTDGELNDMEYRRLKDKLGTKSVPTGEIEFEGAEASLVGEPERGFKYMSEMLNVERLYNAIGSIGGMGRSLLEAKVHTANREAFGGKLAEQPLMQRDLVNMAVDHEAAMAVTFEAAAQFGARERALKQGDEDHAAHALMRILIPVAKYKTARMAVDTATYAMEIRGGNGYVEEFVNPRLLRNAQVLPIWEGPSNIMALDVLRAMVSEQAHESLLTELETRLDEIDESALEATVETARDELDGLEDAFGTIATAGRDTAQFEAKELADYIFDVTAAVLLLERAEWSLERNDDAREALVAEWFIRRELQARDARGIAGRSRLSDHEFDAIIRFNPVTPGQVRPVSADD